MIAADLGRATVIAILASTVITGHATVWLIFAVLFLVTTGQSFFDSAAQATIPAIIGRDQRRLDILNGRFWTLDSVGRAFLGPLIGAATFSWWQPAPFVLAAISFLISAGFVARLPGLPGTPRTADNNSFITTMKQGLVFFRNSRQLQMASVATSLFNVGINIATATLVLFSKQILGLNSTGYGILVAAMAVGAIIGGWRIAAAISRFPNGMVLTGTLLLQGFCWALVAAIPILPVTLMALVLIGVATVINTVACAGQLQRAVPDAMMGRATAVYRVFAIGAGGIGAVVGGVVTTSRGLTAGPITAAAMLIAVSGAALAILASSRRR